MPPIPNRAEGVDGTARRRVNIYQRYETAIALRLSRTLHELERIQRMRKGEHVPPPAAVDVIEWNGFGLR